MADESDRERVERLYCYAWKIRRSLVHQCSQARETLARLEVAEEGSGAYCRRLLDSLGACIRGQGKPASEKQAAWLDTVEPELDKMARIALGDENGEQGDQEQADAEQRGDSSPGQPAGAETLAGPRRSPDADPGG